jgi:trehalose utilization protein
LFRSRDQVNVRLSLEPSKLGYDGNPRIHRTRRRLPGLYGKGRVFDFTLGHTEGGAWGDPNVRTNPFEAIKWASRMTEGSAASHPGPVAFVPAQ